MSIRGKLLIPIVLLGIMIFLKLIIWEKMLNQINSYQNDSVILSNYNEEILNARIELDQFILTNKRKDFNNFQETTRRLILKSDSLRVELSLPEALENHLASLTRAYIANLDIYLDINQAIEKKLLSINDYGESVLSDVVNLSEPFSTQDSLYIYTDQNPEDFSEYVAAQNLSYDLIQKFVELRASTREYLVTNDSSRYSSILLIADHILADIRLADENQYLDVQVEDLDTTIYAILDTLERYTNDFRKFEIESAELTEYQLNIERAVLSLNRILNDRLDALIARARFQSYLLYGFALLLFMIMTYQLIRVFARPVTKIKNAIDQIAAGNHIKQIDIKSRDEFQEIGNALINMDQQIRTKEQELLKSNLSLKQSNEELEAFAYSVSHDLRTPLRSISGFSQALVTSYADQLDDKAKDYLDRVTVAAQKMGHLIDDILKLSRISRSAIHLERINLSELAKECFRDLEETGLYSHIEKVDFHIPEPIELQADPGLAEILLYNLLGNAVKFTSRQVKPRIELKKAIVNNTEYVSLSDNGIGFNMKYVDKLFNAFQRLHSDSEFKGTGIGLATVKRIISKHGGNVFVESKEHLGTTFYFNFGGRQ